MKPNPFLAVLLLLATMLLTACFHDGGNDSPPPPPQTGTVTGTVISAMTGAPISGATVRAGAASVVSAADGSYTLSADINERAIISIAAAGFAETFQITRLATGRTAALKVQLLPVGVTQAVTIATGGTVTVPDSSAQVTIPAGALVSATGGVLASTVNVSLTPINPAIDSRVMPGDFTALLSGSASPVPIESFGALLVDVRDASGTRATLATGQTATIRIPLGTLSASPPATIPLLIFNETTGLWVEDGIATLAGTAGNLFYTGTVRQFGSWNADQAMNTIMLSGCVRDTANQPVENVSVRADGVNYSGSASTVTDADGNFRVAVRRDGLVTLSVTFSLNGTPVTKTINAGPYTADATLTPCIETAPVPLSMTARTLPAGITGTPYSARLAATNGTKPYSWSFSGALPTGLTLDSATGQISGTPTAAGIFAGTFQVQDSSTPVQSATTPFSITVTAPAPFAIPSQSLPNGTVGTSYNISLTAANGTQPYAWSVIAGALPTGLTLGTTGQISGTPTVAGAFPVTIQVQDSLTQSASAPFIITVTAPAAFAITTPSLPAGYVGTSYNASLTAANGTSPYTWSVIAGTLPTGLTLGTIGQISGTPTVAGTFPVTIQVQDSAASPQSVNAPFSITVSTSPPPPPPGGTVVAAGFRHTCALANGTVRCWGINSSGELGNGTTIASSAPVTVTGITTATAIAAGTYHTCAVLANGTVQCWGFNGLGTLGNGTTSNSSTPVTVTGITTATAIAAGIFHTCAALANGTVQCWGDNGSGQLGNGTTTNSSTPVTVTGITTATAIAAGRNHACVALANGTLQCWGDNSLGQLGNGTTSTSTTPWSIRGLEPVYTRMAGACAGSGNP